MGKLYEMAIAHEAILRAIETADGEMTDEQMETLLQVEGDIDTKVSNTLKLIEELGVLAAGCDAAAKRLAEKKRRHDNHAKWLKAYIVKNLKIAGRPSAGDATHKAAIKQGSLKVDDLEVRDGVPVFPVDAMEFINRSEVIKLDKKAALDDAKADPETAEALGNLGPDETIKHKGITIRRGLEGLRIS